MKPKVEGLMIDRMDRNQEIVNRDLNDPAFRSRRRVQGHREDDLRPIRRPARVLPASP
jgi:hypothetical protein